ncbi:MAG: pyridoxamine 5'-phosphate oxidase [Campylobacterales bacterium]|nr:pyridoxamine 5'-phosphate oxidase [Campylobacterales bacterium]
MLDLQEMRQEYKKDELSIESVSKDPLKQFEIWFEQVQKSEIKEPNTMVLATTSKDGFPNLRAVLLKIFDEKGFTFFTNYDSAKAKEIENNSKVALEFLWLDLERQVRVVGECRKISTKESLKYFAKRSRGSQLGAWVSNQSSVISSRSMMMSQLEKIKEKFKNKEVPIPSFWGGYRVEPIKIEFWQGREHRLHDRILYTKEGQGWKIERLAP